MKDQTEQQLDEIISSSDLKNTMLSVGAAMRKLRIEKGYKCAEYFAFDYQLNRSAYYGWENGKNISLKKLITVCEALDISLLEFFQYTKLPKRRKREIRESQRYPEHHEFMIAAESYPGKQR